MADEKFNIEIGAKIDNLAKKTDQVLGHFQKIKNAAKKIAIGAILLRGFTQARTVILDVINRLDDLGKSARSVGVMAEDFQKLAFAARRNNMDLGRFTQAFQKMQRTIDDANDQLATQIRIFDKLGISLDDILGKNPAQQFKIMTDALIKQTNATQRAALANEIFGRAGKNVLNMARDYEVLGDELERLGGVINEETIQAAEDAKDALESLKTVAMASVGQTTIIDSINIGLKQTLELVRALRAGGFIDTLNTIANFDPLGVKGEGVLREVLAGQPLGIPPLLRQLGLGTTREQDTRREAPTAKEIELKRQENEERRLGNLYKPPLGGVKGKQLTMGQALSGDPFLRIGGAMHNRPMSTQSDAVSELRKANVKLDRIAYLTSIIYGNEFQYWQNQIQQLFTNGVP